MIDYSKKWFKFMDLASTSLMQGQALDNYKPNIQIIIEPSFGNHIFLQLQIDDECVKWYRTTWLRLVDAPKFSDPIIALKFIGQTILPTIQYENGETSTKNIEGIIDFIRLLSVKPRIDKWGGIILDGCYYTLIIGVESTTTTYRWHYVPDEWTDLQKLANMLEELNEILN